jgi:hypothetical protein
MSEETKKPDPITTFIPAAPGTKVVSFMFTYDDDAHPPYLRFEQPVVAWRIRHYPDTEYSWAVPVTPKGLLPEEDDYAVVMPDGTCHFETEWPDADFQGTTVEAFAEFVGASMRRCLDDHRCMDCDKTLAGLICSAQSPMLQDDVWREIVPDGDGLLCVEDMEKNLGRPLVRDDLKKLGDDGNGVWEAIEFRRKIEAEKKASIANKIKARMATPKKETV